MKISKARSVAAPSSRTLLTPDMERLAKQRIVIENVTPQLDAGRYAIKREVGDVLEVSADIFRDGHDILRAVVKYRPWYQDDWIETAMACINPGLDLWVGRFSLTDVTTYVYTVEAWTDVFETWRQELRKKVDAGQNVESELLEGARLISEAAGRGRGADAKALAGAEQHIRATCRTNQAEAVRRALDDDLATLLARYAERRHLTVFDGELEVVVDRVQARFAAWYELFPRSQGTSADESGTFQDCIRRLPDIQRMGFDVIYLPPIHPIGHAHRKGKNNSLTPEPNDPGSPWAIGNETGGYKSIESSLGDFDDFHAFVEAAKQHGIEIALDFAIQCAPDHPYAREHPEWFSHRPDGTIKYAENPPKKYQDIYPVNFDSPDWPALWHEMKSIVLFWIKHGVTTFRVDNPHTKPVRFWEWLIREVKRDHPNAIFLSEAFTRPKMMKVLAKSGFTQSYTYFTWRNAKQELTEYLTELTQTDMAEYFRANLFTNTPDILHAYLQQGGCPAFKIRLILAATLSSVYGIYSGFELCENQPLHPGSEEYMDSEKYQLKPRDWDRPGNIKDFIALVNRVRCDNPALQLYKNLHFHPSDNEQILCYSKATPDFGNVVIVVVNLDPHRTQEGFVALQLTEVGLEGTSFCRVDDQITGTAYEWRGARNYVRLDPHNQPAHLFVLRR